MESAVEPIDALFARLRRADGQGRIDVATRNELVERFMPIVRKAAAVLSARLPRAAQLDDDLQSIGAIGLLGAIESYDITVGVKFATYASHRVRGAMSDFLRELDVVPRQTRRRIKLYERVFGELASVLDREPTDDELVERLSHEDLRFVGTPQRVIFTARQHRPDLLSLDKVMVEGTDGGRDICAAQSVADPRDRFIEADDDDEFRRLMVGFTSRERLMLELLYRQELTMRETGQAIGISESRISQMNSLALARLRAKLEPAAA